MLFAFIALILLDLRREIWHIKMMIQQSPVSLEAFEESLANPNRHGIVTDLCMYCYIITIVSYEVSASVDWLTGWADKVHFVAFSHCIKV